MKTMNDELYLLYLNTMSSDIEDKSFRAACINSDIPHRVGCSNEGFPMLFVECCNKEKVSDIKLSMFRVLFNRKCSLADIDNKTVTERDFSIIQMNSDNQDLIKYFFQVMSIVLKRLPNCPKVSLLKQEISKVIEIFTLQQNLSREVVRGLWAELLVIERCSDPEYLIKAWHEQPEDRYDFNDSVDKLEVKSTTGDYRSHIFSLEQLSPNDNADLLIASVFVNSTGIGKSIFDIEDMISEKIHDIDCKLKLSEIILKTIGPNIEECEKMRYDYNFAVDTIRYYDAKAIPSIRKNDVPVGVSSVHFRSDLTETPAVKTTDYKESVLFNSL